MAASQIDIGLGVRDNTRQAFDKFQRQLSVLKNNVERKFSTVDIGKQILGGLGIGSGFALAQTGVEKLTDYFRQQAELAERIERSTAETLASTERMIALRRTDTQNLADQEKKFARIGRELEAAKNIDRTASRMTGAFNVQFFTRDFTDAENEKIATLTKEYQLLGEEIDKGKISAAAKQMDTLATAARSAGRSAAEVRGLITPEDEARAADVAANFNDALEDRADHYRDLADPMREYRRQLEEISELERLGTLDADAAMGARISVYGKQADAINGRSDTRSPAQVRSEIDGVKTETEQLSDAARDLGFSFSSAFEDAVIGGQKVGDVLRGLADDILRMGLRMSVTNPLLNAVFGLTGTSALPTLGFRAAGGPVSAGSPFIVGENGPELFTPSQAGRIIPNHAMGNSGGGAGGGVFNFSYNFASGVTRQEVGAMLPELIEASKRSVMDAVNRGGAFRRAFA